MLNSGKKNCASRDKKNKYSNSRVVGKKILNEAKNHNPSPPLQVKWSVPNNGTYSVFFIESKVSSVSVSLVSKSTKAIVHRGDRAFPSSVLHIPFI